MYNASIPFQSTPPANLPLIVPTANILTQNPSTGSLKTKSIEVTGNISGVTTVTSTNFVGSLKGNATSLTNGVYLDNTGTQTLAGHLFVQQLNVDGKRCIYQDGTGGGDTRANLRVLANLSSAY